MFSRKALTKLIVPLVIEQFLAVLVGMADIMMVSSAGEAAVSSVALVDLINLLILNIFAALATGGAVVAAQAIGARDRERASHIANQLIYIVFGISVVITILVLLLKGPLLRLLFGQVEQTVMAGAISYFAITALSYPFIAVYNGGAALFRAMGNSKVSMGISALMNAINIAGNALCVFGLGMGVEGVAWATVIAQAVSALLVIVVLLRTQQAVRLIPRDLRIHLPVLRQIIRVGVPSALQMAITAFSNVFVQSYINSFGADCMGGWTAYTKIDQLMLLPMQSLALSATTFVGQNLGRGNEPRARQGVRRALAIAMAATVLVMIPVLVFAPQMTAFFNRKPEVVAYGALLLRCISPFYVLCCFNQVYAAALRGAGNSKATMIIMLCSFVLFRQVYLFIMSHYISHELIPLVMGYPAGWLVCSAATLIYYRRTSFLSTRLVAEDGSKEDIQ